MAEQLQETYVYGEHKLVGTKGTIYDMQNDDEIDYHEHHNTLAKNEYFPMLQEYIESNYEIPDELFDVNDLTRTDTHETCSVSSMESLSSLEELEDLDIYEET